MELKIELPQPKNPVQIIKDEAIDTFNTGAQLFKSAAKYIRDASTNFYEQVIKPNALPIAATAAVASVGAAGIATVGLASMVSAGITTSYIALGGVGTVGAVGLTAKVFGWMNEGIQFARESITEIKQDIGNFINAYKKASGEFFGVMKERQHEKFEKKINSSEGNAMSATLKKLDLIKNRYSDDLAITQIIDNVTSASKEIFELAHTQHIQALGEAEQSGIKAAESRKQINAHLNSIKDALTTNIFTAYNEAVQEGGDGAAALASQLDAIRKLASEFKIKPIVDSKITIDFDTSLILESSKTELNKKLTSIFNQNPIKETTAENIITVAATDNMEKTMQILRTECDGMKVTYNPDDNSVLSQAIKQVSIPANRDIPHFNKLKQSLMTNNPELVTVNEDGSLTITIGDRNITLTQANAGGGKVFAKFGNNELVSFWNDKTEEIIRRFVQSKKYPILRPDRNITERVIKTLEAN